MSDRLINDQEAYIAHLFKKKKVVRYRPVITVEYPLKISFFYSYKAYRTMIVNFILKLGEWALIKI